MEIVTSQVKQAEKLSDYYLRNDIRFASWHPLVKNDHHSIKAWKLRLKDREADYREGRAVHFVGLEEKQVIGTCSLTNIIYSPACYCIMGYSIDAAFEGKGYMSQLARHAIDYAFTNIHLNRISANYMPTNTRSARLLEKLGFEKEGFAKRYLFINGRWEDHVLTSLINPESEDEVIEPEH